MGLGRSFVLAVFAFAITAVSMGYVPTLIRDYLGKGSAGVVVQTPNYDAGLLLGLAILAGAFAFAQKITEGSNMRLSGFYGIIKYVVTIYYTLALLHMIGTILLPDYNNATIQVTFLLLGTLVILGIALNMLALIVKISAPKEFEKRTKTPK
jgi:phosphatidylserine synthase